MPEYVIEEVKGSRPGTGDWAHMQTITFRAKGESLDLEWFTKKETPLPTVGSTFSAQPPEEKEFQGRKYLRVKKQQAGFGGGGGPRGKSPEERRSIARQHAQKAAMSYAQIKGDKGDLPQNFKVSDLKPIIDWLFNDVIAAEKA